MVGAGVISHQMLMTHDGARKKHERADRTPDARDRGEERSVQAICLRYRLLNRRGASVKREDQHFDELQPQGCKGAPPRSLVPTVYGGGKRLIRF